MELWKWHLALLGAEEEEEWNAQRFDTKWDERWQRGWATKWDTISVLPNWQWGQSTNDEQRATGEVLGGMGCEMLSWEAGSDAGRVGGGPTSGGWQALGNQQRVDVRQKERWRWRGIRASIILIKESLTFELNRRENGLLRW